MCNEETETVPRPAIDFFSFSRRFAETREARQCVSISGRGAAMKLWSLTELSSLIAKDLKVTAQF